MELKEFVSQALAEIIQGVLDAQSTLGANGKYVNPSLYSSPPTIAQLGFLTSKAGQQPVQNVEFDVAVTISTAEGTKGGIGVVAGIFAIGSHGQSSSENVALSRLKFSVPITLPYGDKIP